MRQHSVSFFWTPKEFVEWTKDVTNEHHLWIAFWPNGKNISVIEPDEIRAEFFEDVPEKSVQIFFGDVNILRQPVWIVENGIRRIDFRMSYAVQIMPPIFNREKGIVLLGDMAIFSEREYQNIETARKLGELFKKLKRSIKSNSNRDVVLAQILANGAQKIWRNIYIGKDAELLKNRLKQFEKGAVEFHLMEHL